MLSGSRLKITFPVKFGLLFGFSPDRDDIRNLARGWQRIHAFTSVLVVNFIVTSMSHSLSKSLLGCIRRFTYLITYFVFELKMTINGLLSTSSTCRRGNFGLSCRTSSHLQAVPPSHQMVPLHCAPS